MRLQTLALLGLLAGCLLGRSAEADGLKKLTFGTDWQAEAEHGGFYQAVANGYYRQHGLDVTIRQGGPGVNPQQLVAAGVVDLQLSSDSLSALNAASHDIPIKAVAAFFQKAPQCLISHPGTGSDTLAEMRGKPIMISASARTEMWEFLKAKYGYTDEQIRPYSFSLAPFLASKTAIQEAFVTSEPYEIERQTGEHPVVNLLSDQGYTSYSTLILARSQMIDTDPATVQAFVEASIEGWYSYLYGDPKPGNTLILAQNRDMSQDVLDHSIAAMRSYGLVDSGDSLQLGIGAMTEARWKAFFDLMAGEGVLPAALDFRKAFDLRFVNKRYDIAARKG